MLAVTRKSKIKELIQEKKSVTVSELAKLFSVTEETIRRDLKALEEEGVLIRTYGGAYIDEGVQNDVNIKIRETLFVENKQKIAEKCAALIHHGDSIFLDASTTSLFIAFKIRDKRITVLTNSLKIANVLADSDTVRLLVTGGTLSHQSMSFLGYGALNSMKNYFVDKAFVSCRSLSMEHGITDSNEQQAEIRQLAIKHATKSYLVVDHTKFNKTSFATIATFEEIDAIVVDKRLDDEWRNFLTELQIEIIECE
ncbi:MAG: DeoR/GlpR transcriptional regulator [Thermoanaerobacter sp.]|nr:DeoR/GlpR transcriptional regulator [Thermoanaerobacter sp.]